MNWTLLISLIAFSMSLCSAFVASMAILRADRALFLAKARLADRDYLQPMGMDNEKH